MTVGGTQLAEFDRGTRDAFEAFAVRAGGRSERADGMFMVVGPHPSPVVVNSAFRVAQIVPPAAALQRIRATYGAVGHGFGLITSAHADADLETAAAASGWRPVIELTGMVCDARLPQAEPRAGAAVRAVDPVRDIEAVLRILRDGFADDDDDDERAMLQVLFRAPAQWSSPGVAGFIGSQDGLDGAFALVAVLHGVATVGWVGTVPELRRRGLADLVTRAATNAGFDLGAHVVILQASPMGRPVYEQMGYRMVTSYHVLAPPAGSGAASPTEGDGP